MKRRTILSAIGAATGAGGLALGTGAFSSVEAERTVSVNVASDANAYLGLQPHEGPNGEYAEITDTGELEIDITGSNEDVGGSGLNVNGLTTIADVFHIQNNGPRNIFVTITPLVYIEGDGESALLLFLVPNDPELALFFGSGIGIEALAPGDRATFSLLGAAVSEETAATESIDDEVMITAEAV